MANPHLLDQKPISLVDVKTALSKIEARDKELTFLSGKAKDYTDTFVSISAEQKEEFTKKILELGIIRLKEEHILKIIDYLPKTVDDLKVVLQAYPLSLSKKDQEAVIAEIAKM